jgi:uncharacterized protein YbaP (TraB family)
MTRNAALRLITLIPGLLFFTHSSFGQKKDYQGLLWEISGNGLKKPGYLYGTMHVSSKVAFHLTDSFFNGLRSADVIALESDPGTWMDEMLDPEFLGNFISRYYGYEGPYAQGFYEKAFAVGFPDKNSVARMFAEENETLNGMLYRMTPMAENYQENTYLDLFIYQTGKKDKKIVTNLENFDETMRLYKKAMKPEKGEKMNYSSMNKLMQKGLNFNEMLEDAYRKGDLDLIDSLNTISAPTKNYRRYFLNKRNEIMVHGMDSIMKKNLLLFTAVGAAHLPGEMGVINQLRRKGYTVRPVNGSVTKSSMSQKDKIEKSYLPQTYVTRFSPDSAFQVDMPGKLYEMPGGGDQRLYLYPEMVNGGYFSVNRMKTYGALRGKNPEYIIASIDSMLYENIPGKILKRSSIKSNTGYPGFDITSKTRSGDNLRYKIFVSPQEVFVFMVGGRGDYARKKEVERFFNSIRFGKTSATNWKKISPENGTFEVEIPGPVIHDEPSYSFQNDKIHAFDQAENAYYLVIKATLQDLNYIEEDTFELGQLAQEFAKQLNYTLEEKDLTSFHRYPALDMDLKSNVTDVRMKGKIIIQGSHYYLLTTTASNESSQKHFFGSFKLKEPRYTDTFFTETDSTIFAQITLPKKPMEKEDLADDMDLDNYNDYTVEASDEEGDESYQGAYASQWYYSDKTDEAISVEYTKFHKYYSIENKDTFWKEKVDLLTSENGLVVKSKTFSDKNGIAEMNLVLTDTASIRSIAVRILMKNSTFYTVSTITDTLTKPSRWVSTFFDNFRPTDSAIGESPFTDKTALFLSDLQNADTTLQKQAKNSIDVFNANFSKKHSADLIKYIKSDAFKKLDLDKRLKLIAALGNVKDPEAVALLKKLYAGALDSVAQQTAILRALGWQQTEKSFAAFTELMEVETPLTSDDSEIDNIFYPFYDTLPLAKKLYPRLLEFATYPEYKSQVYSLLATLVDSGYVKKEMYSVYKKRILKEANEELRRQFAGEEKEKIASDGSYDNEYSDYGYYTNDYGYTNPYEAGNSAIYNYTVLLIPYYNEPAVKAYFDKLKKSQDKALRLNISMLLLRNNLPVHDSIWTSYARDDAWKLRLYSDLKDAKRLDKFNDSFRNQLDFAKAGLYGTVSKKDTIVFIGKRLIENRYKKGYVYFFKRKAKDDEEGTWRLEYAGLQPADTAKVETENVYAEKFQYEVSDDEKEVNDKVNEIVKQLNLEGRKRMSQKRLRNEYYDY